MQKLQNRSLKFKIITLGCPLNQSDSDSFRDRLLESGFNETADIADIYIINSCVVTQKAARNSRKEARKAKKLNPNSIVCLMGCYGEIEKEVLKNNIPEIDHVVGTKDRNYLLEELTETTSLVFEKTAKYDELGITHRSIKSRPVVKIQEGCNNKCSYCIVTIARGQPRSRKYENIKKQVTQFLENGYKEIILAGTNMGVYGIDLQTDINLATLLDRLASLPYKNFRLRLSSLEPMEVTEEVLQVIKKHNKICNNLYLPLQSGSDNILKRMNRNYTTDDFAQLVNRARTLMPDISIVTDLISGFPGEQRKDHKRTMEFVSELRLSKVHVFTYSPRPYTLAYNFKDQVRPDIKKRRTDEIKQLDLQLTKKFHEDNLKSIKRILIEQINNIGEHLSIKGFSDNYCLLECTVGENDNIYNNEFIYTIGLEAHEWGIKGQVLLPKEVK
ncbi:tRNA (N(6)-L-threonylcarbamoyladenosine(37)-C(2))-methylthiotransferase MtaB [Natranaerobius trueperi]|uniref:tRNA (N(6)-L-threonylcarbamoyladenosine(37)-C(2))-methylthiotransferase MtaB n=1 Tax=Natranaerobius trueperi TaxID=759412 RepID=A0A226BZ32_9FIRM|nr:tRNA (N(6)-L-threonylcarbamoyladenosine(37)-C(2))-methylthiotransferase MtaB [Natranaerobius trueperi]OWZ83459.1 tRNA (N(6)-L-threonylcarbamoyladenosine(37)-C(2))-methylthiotransferase MtaB [Natranaerobius trueperi]